MMQEILSELLRNDLFQIGGIHIYAYGCLIAMGLLLALALIPHRIKKYQADELSVYNFIFWLILVGFLSAKLCSMIQNFSQIQSGIGSWILHTGFVVYGGIIGGILFSFLYFRKDLTKFVQYTEIVVPLLPLIQGFGRLGCLFAGCCYGKETDLPFSIVYQYSTLAPNEVPLFPVQFVSACLDFGLFFLLWIIERKKNCKMGELTGIYFLCYSIGRFFIEFFRGDEIRGVFGPLSFSQYISIILLLFACLVWRKVVYQTNGNLRNE